MKKNIVVLGGNGLIGKKIVQKLSLKNYNIIILDKNFKKRSYENTFFYYCDVCNESLLLKKIKELFLKFKKIHAVINLAYPKNKNWGKKFENLNFTDLKTNIAYQLGSSIIIAKIFSRYFLKQKFGNLIFFSSIQGISAPKFEHYRNTKMVSPIEYSASKAGIINITRYLAKYFKGKNIRFNCISPGGIYNNQSNSFVKNYRKSCLSKGLLNPEDLFGLIEFLISEESKYINGQNIIIDDGWSL